MQHPLQRLLRLRSLVEETSRMELESRAALAARIQQRRARELETVRENRAYVIASISEDGEVGEQAERRGEGWSAAEGAARRERQLAPLSEAADRRVAEVRDEFIERRKERRQVESILDEAKERVRIEQERRAQRSLDDWFGMKRVWQNQGRERASQS